MLTGLQLPPRAAIMSLYLSGLGCGTREGSSHSIGKAKKSGRLVAVLHLQLQPSLNLDYAMHHVVPCCHASLICSGLSLQAAQAADSGIITLQHMPGGAHLSRESLPADCSALLRGGADKSLYNDRHCPQGPLRNKLARPQPLWHNMIGQKGGSAAPASLPEDMYTRCSTLSLP